MCVKGRDPLYGQPMSWWDPGVHVGRLLSACGASSSGSVLWCWDRPIPPISDDGFVAETILGWWVHSPLEHLERAACGTISAERSHLLCVPDNCDVGHSPGCPPTAGAPGSSKPPCPPLLFVPRSRCLTF